jgi:hypothetical protein
VFPRHARALPRRMQDVWANGVIMTCKPCGQALQHHAIVHRGATDRSQVWRYSTTPCNKLLVGTVGRGYDPIGRGYAKLQPNRMGLRYKPFITWQDQWNGACHAPLVPSSPCTGI